MQVCWDEKWVCLKIAYLLIIIQDVNITGMVPTVYILCYHMITLSNRPSNLNNCQLPKRQLQDNNMVRQERP
ncbi:hypothetical protein BpHYR1_026679 [Brachionus plicatilis]|uniref:Uncharacterized protein n=1 Tax=Brachionus plicatilis TaxID=10195 RepID=A0A3M7Q2D6_BRAPC|nr:hypothetical protein BpHYR1_026679 [Brachionus plicatilis]